MAPRKPTPPSKSVVGMKKTAGPSKPKSPPAGSAGSAGKPPARRTPPKTRSIVNQRQTPWSLIITTFLVVLFAVGIVGYAVVHKKSSSDSGSSSNPYTQPELADAKQISGMIYKKEPDHNHVNGTVKYDSSPPVGGNHSPYWADCAGTVYPNAIANENAVHMLEHGAVWITYKPGLAADQVATLSKLVDGVDRLAMSPYPDLETNISLQAWGYQLFVDNASDPRIQKFILTLRFNPKTTPESTATCPQPTFKARPSTFGHPLSAPAAK